MSADIRAEYYRVLDIVEHIATQLQSLDLGPLRDMETGARQDAETEALRAKLRERLDQATRRLGELSKALHA